MTDTELAAFLAHRLPAATEAVAWGEQLRFRCTSYLGDEPPPLAVITSARAVVLRDGQVLVQRDRNSLHILPGGRHEADELPETTLRREVREETGWTLGAVQLLGFVHYHHLSPKPPDYAYPHPDFCHLVYAARATAYSPADRLDDGYEVESSFRTVAAVRDLSLSPRELVFLEATLRAENSGAGGAES